jgi:hypothetical protein
VPDTKESVKTTLQAEPMPTFRFTQTPEFMCCGVVQRGYRCVYCGPSTDRDTRGSRL